MAQYSNSMYQPSPAACSQAPLGVDCCCCKRCGMGGCDLKVMDCKCCLHTRCCPASEADPLVMCPICMAPVRALTVLPMSFAEIDQAQEEAARTELSNKRGKKRQNATVARLQPSMKAEDNEGSDLRTGRWTTEETAYCDKLISLFEHGKLPIPDGIKLNDFLANMLKSKQSRLTKKMKNAKLSTKLYRHIRGYITDVEEAREFSLLECAFFKSIRCNMERSEIKFHMQKEWRELFSNYCVAINQKLDAVAWLSSVEEMDRREALQKDAARIARRKIMMGYALSHDTMNPPSGVFIDPNANDNTRLQSGERNSFDPDRDNTSKAQNKRQRTGSMGRPLSSFSSPFVGKAIQFVQRFAFPFEHVDCWVPSLVPGECMGVEPTSSSNGECRLCFAGDATAEVQIPPAGGLAVPLTSEEEFDLVSFGLYSQKFSFDVGCGLPGRVYKSGVASWEQGIQNAPPALFERCGGAKQWGIQTVLGVPVASPNVGRVVVLFYSRYDRPRDDKLASRITEELTKFMPTPHWKLVVDVGVTEDIDSCNPEEAREEQHLLSLVTGFAPADQRSPLAEYLPGFTSLRLLLSHTTASSAQERHLVRSAIECFKAYKAAGRSDKDATWMTARDFMVISKSTSQSRSQALQLNSIQHGVSQNFAKDAATASGGMELGQLGSMPTFNMNLFATTPSFGSQQIGQAVPITNMNLNGLSPALQPIPVGGHPHDANSNSLASLGLPANFF